MGKGKEGTQDKKREGKEMKGESGRGEPEKNRIICN